MSSQLGRGSTLQEAAGRAVKFSTRTCFGELLSTCTKSRRCVSDEHSSRGCAARPRAEGGEVGSDSATI